MEFKLYNDDCLNALKTMEENSIDSCVTDPPYGLSYMNKGWDYDVPKAEIWKEVFRVLKPGGHLLAFFGSRTYHRGTIQIEDAGFEIRDQIMWLYGTGFPKSHEVGEGVGTALKPAHEPVVVARKPISEKTVAANVSKYGTGGINIEEGRVGDRWPANVLHDGAITIEEGRYFYSAKASKADKEEGLDKLLERMPAAAEFRPNHMEKALQGDDGNPYGRWSERKNIHPTVKPTDLMKYLVKLVTPKGGTVLDPFMGSGSTGKACGFEGFKFVGVEMDKAYFEIAELRIKHAYENKVVTLEDFFA